ncbi:macrophage mannose receptor 1-like, partial [Saccostrea cucullata]|uniref:macrophage mannose receptor 1-like n=1 Tax=Saccostrea cuccullata TaxID=36930 RepID=UPI002ED1F5F8
MRDGYSEFWIGLNNIEQDGWKWDDGTSDISFVDASLSLDPLRRCVYEDVLYGDGRRTENCNMRCDNLVCMKRTGSDELVTTARYTPVRSGGCPSGFVESPINNKCYKIVQDSRLNFRQAKYSCSVLGKDFSLVSIHSAMENAFIELQFDTTKSKNLWIGLFDNNYYYDKRYFIWMDNSRVDFTNWARGEPNSLTEGCAEMSVKDGSWNSISCFLNRSYICQTNKGKRSNICQTNK